MTDLIVGSSLHRALNRYGIPNRITVDEKHLVVEEKRVTTDAYEKDADKVELLGKMTEWETKLFRRAGFDAVVKFRRWEARETYRLEDWREVGRSRYTTKATPDQKPMAGAKAIAPHRREDTGAICACGLIDMEAAYYSCPYTNAAERRRRMKVRDFADALPMIIAKLRELDDARQVRSVPEGTRPEPMQGPETGKQEQEAGAAERLSLLPREAGQGDRATTDDPGRDTADPGSGSGVRPGERPATAGIPGIRERLGPSTVPSGKTPVEKEPMAMAPRVLPQREVSAEDRTGSETSDAAGMEAPRTVNKGGRPRKYADSAERKRAYRARQRGEE